MTNLADNTITGNLAVMLQLITQAEGTDRQGTPYNELFGFSNFNSYATHPQVKVPFYNPRTKKNDFSTAAGRYQINYPTFKELGMKDFTPASQDKAAIKLLDLCGALDYVLAGDWENAIRKASSRWASLPGSNSKQPQVALSKALSFIKNNNGTFNKTLPAVIVVAALSFIIYKFA